MKKIYMTIAVAMFLGAGVANAYTINFEGAYVEAGEETGTSQILATLTGLGYDVSEELYKSNVGGGESGSFGPYYETTFMNDPLDPADADIDWVGPDHYIDGDETYLLVKDGNSQPYFNWYFYDISDWDGMETIELRGFWPTGGAISHVAIYGDTAPVPEPATMLLFGAGLAGLAGVRRKKK